MLISIDEAIRQQWCDLMRANECETGQVTFGMAQQETEPLAKTLWMQRAPRKTDRTQQTSKWLSWGGQPTRKLTRGWTLLRSG